MVGLRSCEQLRREHELIGRVVASLGVLTQRRGGRSAIPVLPATGAVDFFASFVARCHDAKEEEAFFPALAVRDGTAGDVMKALQGDHEDGHRMLGELRPCFSRHRIDGRAWDLLDTYLGLLRRHIATEDRDLLPIAERVLSADDDARLERAFQAIEERELGRSGTDALVALADAVTQVSHAFTVVSAGESSARADSIMRPRAGVLAPDDSLARAAELMRSLETRELPVVRDSALVGIVTRTDLEPHRGHFEWTAVRAAMTPNPMTVAPDTALGTVAGLLLRHGFNAIPVTDRGTFRGMISRSDVLRALAGDERPA